MVYTNKCWIYRLLFRFIHLLMKKNIFTELLFWKNRKVLSDEQYKTMKHHYDKKQEQENGATSSKFIAVVSVVGALFVGAGIILFFSSNWDLIPDIFKTILLVVTMLITYGLWFWLYYVKNYQKTGYALVLLGSMMYGANIFLIWQIYNIWGSWIDAMWLWAVWIVPLAYITRFTWLAAAFFLLFNIFLMNYVGEHRIINEDSALFFVHVLWLIYISLGKFHSFSKYEEYRRFGGIYQVVWILWVLITLLLTTVFEFWSEIFFNADVYSLWTILWVMIWGAALLQWAVILFQQNVLKQKAGLYMFWLLAHTLFFLILSFASPKFGVLLMNFYFVFVLLYLLYAGVMRQSKWFVNIAFVFFVVFLIVKYVDIFSSMLSQSLFLIAWGVFFIVWWYFLERMRRKLLKESLT